MKETIVERKYKGWFGRKARRRCPHSYIRGLYGDEINHANGYRIFCMGCGRYLDGPVRLEFDRSGEWFKS